MPVSARSLRHPHPCVSTRPLRVGGHILDCAVEFILSDSERATSDVPATLPVCSEGTVVPEDTVPGQRSSQNRSVGLGFFKSVKT